MNVFHFTNRQIMKVKTFLAQSLPANLDPPSLGHGDSELGRNQTTVTHFQWTTTLFGFTQTLTYSLTKD